MEDQKKVLMTSSHPDAIRTFNRISLSTFLSSTGLWEHVPTEFLKARAITLTLLPDKSRAWWTPCKIYPETSDGRAHFAHTNLYQLSTSAYLNDFSDDEETLRSLSADRIFSGINICHVFLQKTNNRHL